MGHEENFIIQYCVHISTLVDICYVLCVTLKCVLQLKCAMVELYCV